MTVNSAIRLLIGNFGQGSDQCHIISHGTCIELILTLRPSHDLINMPVA